MGGGNEKQIEGCSSSQRAVDVDGNPRGLRRPVTQPGETAGIAVGAPLPEGLYFLNTADRGCRNSTPTSCLGITIPIASWSTPRTLLGARVQFFTVTPVIETGVSNTSYQASFFNPALFGAVAYGFTDLTSPIATYLKQSQFAVGGLSGYDFGPLSLQVYATIEEYERNYGGRDTRGWFRLVVPLWKPAAQPPLINKG